MLIAVTSDVLREDVGRLVIGELIAAAGLAALILHRLRSRTTDRSVLYFGITALFYGLRLIFDLEFLRSAFPWIPWQTFIISITLFIGIPFVLYLGSTLARAYPVYTRVLLAANLLFALVGTYRLITHGSLGGIWHLNGWLVVVSLVGWIYIGAFPRIPIDSEVRALRIGLLVMGLFTLEQNLSVVGVLPVQAFWEPLGMIFLLGTFFYVSVSRSLRLEGNLIAIQKELGIARQIQAALLPKLDEQISGLDIHARYSPAGSVAGDFYDVLRNGPGLGVLIADVSGHGVPAALSASMLKVALRAQMAAAADPAQVLAGLNRTLSGILGDQFITAAYVYFDTGRRELRYAGAGHPPLFLWRFAEKQVKLLEENGLFLGPFAGAEYSAITSPFEPGDRCLLYTDGLVEAEDRNEGEFGASRLSEFLVSQAGIPAEKACSALLHQVIDWSGGSFENQQDDISFVLIEFRENAAVAAA